MTEPITLTLLAVGWCALHSLLIAAPVTKSLRALLGPHYRFYRLAFNLVSVVTLLPLMSYRASMAGKVFFAWDGGWRAPQALLIALSVFLFVAGARPYDKLQFLGIRQLMGELSRQGLTAGGGLDTTGILGFVRHPWYLGALLLIWARPLDWSVTTVNVVFSVYLVVGTLLEERKMVAEFGDEYRQYQRRVPMLVPGLRRHAS